MGFSNVDRVLAETTIIHMHEEVNYTFMLKQAIPFSQTMATMKFNSSDRYLLLTRLQKGRLETFHRGALLQTINDPPDGDRDVRTAAVLKRTYCFPKPTQHVRNNILEGIVCAKCCRSMQFVEEKQWEISGLEGTRETVEVVIKYFGLYNPQSNEKYMEEERKNNLFIASTMDFFVFQVPLKVFLLNRLFYRLFNFEISSFPRPYSFWWMAFGLLIQDNIESFTFLAFRNRLAPYSFDLPSRVLQESMMVMFFLVVLGAFAGYLCSHL